MHCSVILDCRTGDVIHLWFRTLFPEHKKGVHIYQNNYQNKNNLVTLFSGLSDAPVFKQWIAPFTDNYKILWDEKECEMSVAYSYRPTSVFEHGINILWCSESARPKFGGKSLYHFNPPFGWMNDPNGLCQIGKHIHMFYQHYPHQQRWQSMHWGNAVSTDMLRWVHLPVFLFPDETRVRNKELIGGAFSGSAHPLDFVESGKKISQGLRVFYTDRADERLPEWEIQMSSFSSDCIVAELPKVIIDKHPVVAGIELQKDFRDPFVFITPDGKLKLLLGSRDESASCVLMYTTSDLTGTSGWEFVSVLHRENRFGSRPAECPCFLSLKSDEEDLWVLIYGMLKSQDPKTGRRHLTNVVVGHFDGTLFEPIHTQEFDIGTDCYAFQAYQSLHGPRGIAWAANWSDYRRSIGNFPTVMTLPRSLIWSDNTLKTPPIPESVTLRQEILANTVEAFINGLTLKDSTAELLLSWKSNGNPFRMDFEHSELDLALTYDGDELRLHYQTSDKYEHPAIQFHRWS